MTNWVNWLNLFGAALALSMGIWAGIRLFRWRTKYYLALFLTIVSLFALTISYYVYPGLGHALVRMAGNPATANAVWKSLNLTLVLLLLAMAFYPNVRRFLTDPKSVSDPDKRDRLYRMALRLFPHSCELTYTYAWFLGAIRGDYERAEGYCQKALRIAPKNVGALGTYAVILESRGDYEGAEGYFLQAIDRAPNAIANLANYANFLLS